ncbi:MAG TPA: hypothetical protein VFF72_11025 [Caldimonas sp.]|nr:hypothetical protein [Caldimonas sp.]
MALERARLLFVGLLSLGMAGIGVWMLVSGKGWHDKAWGTAGVIFFGLGGGMLLHSATKDELSLTRQVRIPTRTRPFVIPAALLVSLPWSQKFSVCLPLLVAWAALLPRYENVRTLRAACGLAVVIAAGQAFLAVMAATGTDPTESPEALVPQLVFSGLVVLIDIRVLWEVYKRLRSSSATQGLPSYNP